MNKRNILSIFVLLMALSLTLGAVSAEEIADNADALTVGDDAAVAEANAGGEDDILQDGEMPVADLEINITYLGESNKTTDEGELLKISTWSTTVANKGPEAANNVTVYLDYSEDLAVYETWPSHGGTMIEFGVWLINEIPANEIAKLTIDFMKLAEGSDYFEVLAIEEDSYDPLLENNYAIATSGNDSEYTNKEPGYSPMPVADLDVNVQAIFENATNIFWSIVVANNGPESANSTITFLDISDNLIVYETSVDHGMTLLEYGVWLVGDIPTNEAANLLIKTLKDSEGPYYIEALAVAQDSYNTLLGYNYNFDIVQDVSPGNNTKNNTDNSSADKVASAAKETLPAAGNPIALALLALISIAGVSFKKK